jgi:hypothetical protein
LYLRALEAERARLAGGTACPTKLYKLHRSYCRADWVFFGSLAKTKS